MDLFERAYHGFVESEARDALFGALDTATISWITSLSALRRAELKLVQLHAAVGLGVPIPTTLVTNDPKNALAFAEECGEVVAKPIRYGLLRGDDSPQVAWTSLVATRDLSELEGVPVILQRFVRGETHLRVTTVGADAFVARLVSPTLDWRSEPSSHDRFEYVADPLPAICSDAVRIAKALRLGFSTQDWMLDESGQWFFLEANPNGQWLFLDEATTSAITQALVQTLEQLAEA